MLLFIFAADSPWGDIPTWISSIVAVGALIMSGISLFRTTKIPELEKMVDILKRQCELHEEALNQQKMEHFLKNAPKLQYLKPYGGTGSNDYQFAFTNSPAIIKMFTIVPAGIIDVSAPIGIIKNPNTPFLISIRPKADTPADIVQFSVNYENDNGEEFVQTGTMKIKVVNKQYGLYDIYINLFAISRVD